MVQNSRETPGAGALRPLNLPVPITVEEDACQRPLTLSKSSPKRGRRLKAASSASSAFSGKSVRQQPQIPSQAEPRLPKLQVVSIDSMWKIDEEWWREKPIVRMYYQVTSEDGRRITLFQDLTTGEWYQQRG